MLKFIYLFNFFVFATRFNCLESGSVFCYWVDGELKFHLPALVVCVSSGKINIIQLLSVNSVGLLMIEQFGVDCSSRVRTAK